MSQILEFWQFCQKVLNLTLTPGQAVIAKIAFGRYNPEDLDGEEHELAREMFGGLDRVPNSARRYICLRLGRGSGKTTICSAYSVYEAVTHDIRRCGPGDVPYVVTIAPDKETAKLSIRMAREMIRGVPALERLVVNDTDHMISIRRPDGRMVRIEAFAASQGGRAVRGRTIIGFLMDEAEFFTSNSTGGEKDFAVNDWDIFRALKPRLLKSGKGMLVSTPWPVETLMGSLFEENWGKAVTAVAVKATTLQVRGNDPEIVEMVNDELAKDPENARRELFCETEGLFGGEFFDVNALHGSYDSLVQEFPIPFNPKWPVAVGCDLGFTRDSSALAVVQYDGKYYRTVCLEELRPRPGQPLKPSHVIERFAILAKAYGSGHIVSDGYYREALKEQLQAHNLLLIDAPEGARGKSEAFQRTRGVLHEGLCRIPEVQLGRRLVQQAKLVTAKASPGGTTTIRVPRKIGLGHGDIVSAWVLAVNKLAYAQIKPEKMAIDSDSPEWAAFTLSRLQQFQEKQQSNYLKSIEKEAKKGMSKRSLAKYFSYR